MLSQSSGWVQVWWPMTHKYMVSFSLVGLGGAKLAIEEGNKSLLIHHSVWHESTYRLLETIQNILDFPNFDDARNQGRTSEPWRLLVSVSLITECSIQQARRETGWKSKEANSQTEQSPVRESWVKEGQKVSGDQNALILPSRTFQTRFYTSFIAAQVIIDNVAHSK